MIESVVESATGETSEVDFLMIDDQIATLHEDAKKLRECELFPAAIEVGEFIFDVENGKLTQIV